MDTNRLSLAQIVALTLSLTSSCYISYLNTKPQLTFHEARTHEVMLSTYEAASRALIFPGLLSSKPGTKKPKPKLRGKEEEM